MPLIDSLGYNDSDCPEPLVVNCTVPIKVKARVTTTWLDDDFLCWSTRQKDAEIVLEYDV